MWTPAEMKLIAILLMFAADFEVALTSVEIQSHYVCSSSSARSVRASKGCDLKGRPNIDFYDTRPLPDLHQLPQT